MLQYMCFKVIKNELNYIVKWKVQRPYGPQVKELFVLFNNFNISFQERRKNKRATT